MANKKIRIRLKAYEHRTLDTAAEKIVETATRTGASVAGPVPLPTERSLYTIIRATHKYKDSREQFEMRNWLNAVSPRQSTISLTGGECVSITAVLRSVPLATSGAT